MPQILERERKEGRKLWDQCVDEVMCHNCVSIEPDATVRQAVRKMKDLRISSIVVQPQGFNSQYAILTRRDIVDQAAKAEDALPQFFSRKVSELATKTLVTLAPGQKVKEAVELLQDRYLRRIPVLDQGRLVGIVSDSDIFDRLPYE